MPSRVRSPTPAKTETPPCWRAMLWISSWIRTVLPVPAPPKRPILPPFTYGAIRSTTLRPVSKISIGRREVAEGRRVAVDRPALDVLAGRLLVVDRLADHVPDPAEGRVADRDRDRRAGVDDVDAAREAVGRVHRDRADAIVAEVLLHLRDQRPAAAVAGRHLDRERVVDLRQLVGEDGVDDDALDLDHLACGLPARAQTCLSSGKDLCRKCDARRRKRARSLAKRPFRPAGCRTRPTAVPGDASPLRSASRRSRRSVCSSASATSAGVGLRGCSSGRSASSANGVRAAIPSAIAATAATDATARRRPPAERRAGAAGSDEPAPRRARRRRGAQLRRDPRATSSAKDAAGRAVGEMRVEQPALEHRQLAVRRQRRPGACARSGSRADVRPITAASRSSRPPRRAPPARSRRPRAAPSC